MPKPIEPFAALIDIARRSVEEAKGLPAQADITPMWTGIGFNLGGHKFVAPMSEVVEILAQPPSTRLPGVQNWVKGVSNVRGRLLPLIDLESFFGNAMSGGRRDHRVLALELGELYTGLIVKEVYGMQHFPVDCYTDKVPDGVEGLEPFLAGSYEVDNANWTVFSPFKLAQNAEFYNAAAV